MQRIFQSDVFFPVADGTSVSPVLSPYDRGARSLQPDALAQVSIAAGEIAPGATSKPHLHPIIAQVTWVLEGALLVRMKDTRAELPYALMLHSGQAVLTEPMTFLQLANPDPRHVARVLYVVTPAYVHLPGDNGYDDAIVCEQTWDELAEHGFPLPRIDANAIRSQRAAAQERLRAATTANA